jgi:predicted nuclease of predicted toxin-antitoxin system
MAEWLSAVGHQADHAAALLSPQADDDAIWAHAVELGAIVITKDQDYLDLASRVGGARIVLVRCGNVKLAAFKAWFSARMSAMEQLLAMGESVVELR